MYVFQFASLTLLSAYLVHYKFPCKIVPDVTSFVLLHKKLSVGDQNARWKKNNQRRVWCVRNNLQMITNRHGQP